MLGVTRRQQMLLAVALLVGSTTVVGAVFEMPRLALAGVATMATMVLLILLDVRVRLGNLSKHIRTMERVQKKTAGMSTSRQTIKRMAKHERRVLAAVEGARLEALDRSAQFVAPDALRNRVAELEEMLAEERAEQSRLDDLQRASYRQSLRQHVRMFRTEDRLKAPVKSAALQLPYKLRNVEFAASHGIEVPELYAVWPDISSIDLGALPEKFVLKADGGAGSASVFPLERRADGRYSVIGTADEYTESHLRERLRELRQRARAPFFAEELLLSADGGPIPNDVKCYMFYGEVGQVLVRNVAEHGNASTIRLKFVDEQGRDFGPVAVGRTHDASIEVPDCLPEMASVAKHLSRAIGLPFCRVDLYQTSRGIVLGEITRAPSGGNERFVAVHDELLGQKWIDGSARLAADLSSGRPVGPLFGTVADLHLYPPSDRPRSPANFARTVVNCSEWCL